MKNHIYIFLLTMVPLFAGAQTTRYYLQHRQLAMGADTSEIYLCTRWYPRGNDSVFESIFHSTDNGCSFAIRNSGHIPYPEIITGKLFSDPTPGVVYKCPTDYPLVPSVSFDTGKTLIPRPLITSDPASGCVPGEICFRGGPGLLRSADYGATFDTLPLSSSSGVLHDVGANPGELYFIGGSTDSVVTVNTSEDYGATLQSHQIKLNCSPSFFDIRRGTSPGEYYLLVWDDLGMEYFYIYHATAYGDTVTFQRKYECGTWFSTTYTAGRKPGSFYVARRSLYFPDLYIDYSTDYGLTFTTCYHYLDSTYTGATPAPVAGEITLFPNPAIDLVTITSTHGPEIRRVEVWDHHGMMCRDFDIPGGSNRVAITTGMLPRGLYLVRVIQKNGRATVKKVVLE